MMHQFNFKDMVIGGIHYFNAGRADYVAWSEEMLGHYGQEIKPHMKDIRKWSIMIRNSGCSEKLNCWQFMGCLLDKGREVCGSVEEYCKCPALQKGEFDGIHGGIKAGRACWIVSHTLCSGLMQGTHEEKYQTCLSCDFYRLVAEEEEINFKGRDELEKMLL